MIAFYLIGIAIGLYMIAAAVFDWDWWFYDAESYLIQIIGGDSMVRWYWGIAGLLLIIAVLVHWIWGKDLWWAW